MYLLLALSRISRELYGVDLAAPLFIGRLLGVPPVAALALGLHPRYWHLALWAAEEPCSAPDWPDAATAVALAAARDGCRSVRYAPLFGVQHIDVARAAAQLDGVVLEPAHGGVKFRILTLDEVGDAVERWLGEPLAAYTTLSPKTIEEKPELAAAVALGAYRQTAAGIYTAEPQLLALAYRTPRTVF